MSDRAEALGWDWSTRLAYWPRNVLTFLVPYINGDISDNTYSGPTALFWEDYGYVGIATFVLAIYGAVRERRRPVVAFTILMTLVAYLFVLGPATPVFRVAYLLVPGMKMFRFPTRFLIVVELGLALLGAIGLTRLGADLRAALEERPLVCLTRSFLRFAWARRWTCSSTSRGRIRWCPGGSGSPLPPPWLSCTPTVRSRARSLLDIEICTPRPSYGHAAGRTSSPYFELRDVLEPNIGGGYWNTPSADCYAGIAARWHVDVWGDHNREALMSFLASPDFEARTLRVHPALAKVLRTYGVSHVLSPFPQQEEVFALVSHERNAYVYRVDGAARVRFARAARHVKTNQEAFTRLLASDFDPDREILLHEAPDVAAAGRRRGRRELRAHRGHPARRDARGLPPARDRGRSPGGRLPAAGRYVFPGWTAKVDGTPTPVYRANVSVRGIRLSKGRHEVRFTYDAPGFARGLQITLLAVSTAAAVGGRSGLRGASRPAVTPQSQRAPESDHDVHRRPARPGCTRSRRCG